MSKKRRIEMDKQIVEIGYKLANGKRIRLEVSIEVKELLEQSDRQIRSQRRQDRRYLDFVGNIDGLTDEAMNDPQESITDLLEKMERNARLYSAIGLLTETQKRRLCLYFFYGSSYSQIARMEGVNHRTVMDSIEQALKRLNKHYLR
jgi:RNA polymerase sigma factor (sigma-70 family)